MQTMIEHIPTETQANRMPIMALLIANAISLIGSMLTLVALPWFVLQTTGSAAKTGVTGFFVALPLFTAGLFGGTLVDRLGYKRSSVIADVISGIGIALVPLLYFTVGLAFWQLLALVFLGNLLTIPGVTARRSMLPELATLARWRLEQINASFEGIQYVALLIGPPVAGLLIALFGASKVLWLDAASFAFSAIVVGLFIPAALTATERMKPGRYRDEFIAGLRFLKSDRLLLALAVCLTLANFVEMPFFGVILPVFAKRAYNNATDLGILVAAIGAGQIVGATLYGTIGHRLRRWPLWIGAYILSALPLAVIVVTTSLPMLAGIFFLTGICAGPLNPLLVTIRHERIPAEMRGRVFSTFSAIANGAEPLGLLLVGNLIERFGLRATVLVIACGALAIGIGMLFIPALHAMDAPAHREPTARTHESGRV